MILLICLILAVLFVLFFFSQIKIEISYKRERENDSGGIKLQTLGGLVKYRIRIPAVDFKDLEKGIKVEEKTTTTKEEKGAFITKERLEQVYTGYEDLLHRVGHLQDNLKWFMSRVTCETWIWETTIGTGDAAEASVLAGIVWGVKTNVLGFISHNIRWMKPPILDVIPSFQHALFHTHYEGIFVFRVGNGIRLLWRLWIRFRHKKTGITR